MGRPPPYFWRLDTRFRLRRPSLAPTGLADGFGLEGRPTRPKARFTPQYGSPAPFARIRLPSRFRPHVSSAHHEMGACDGGNILTPEDAVSRVREKKYITSPLPTPVMVKSRDGGLMMLCSQRWYDPVHLSTFGMIQEYLTDNWHGLVALVARLVKQASPDADCMPTRIKRRETLHTVWCRDPTALQVEANPADLHSVAEGTASFEMPGRTWSVRPSTASAARVTGSPAERSRGEWDGAASSASLRGAGPRPRPVQCRVREDPRPHALVSRGAHRPPNERALIVSPGPVRSRPP